MEWGNPKPELNEILGRIMLRRTKDQVLPDLPPKMYEEVVVKPATEGEWKKIAKRLDDLQEDATRSGLPPFDQMSEVRKLLAQSRIPAVIELVEDYEEAGKPVVVASAHRAPLLALGERPGWGVIVGGTPPQTRQRLVEDFQAGKLKGLAIAIEAAGVGITLTRADTMIFVDLAWKPGDNRQAEDRIHRVGAKGDKVLYRTLVSPHPLDRHVTRLLRSKQAVVDAAIDTPMTYTPPPPPPRGAGPGAQRQWGDIQSAIKEARTSEARRKLQGTRERMEERGEIFPSRFTAAQVAAMENALGSLAGVCDFAMKRDQCGFNKSDTYTGHSLAMTGLGDPLYQEVAYGVLRKYRGQIGPHLYETIYTGGRSARRRGRRPRPMRRY